MKIHKDGFGTVAAIWVVCIILGILTIVFIKSTIAVSVITAFLVFVMCFILYFFRVPLRRGNVTDARSVTSVADGEVVIIEKVFEPEYLKKECWQVSVYMSFFNMHVNFWPVSGKVSYYKYHPGKYLLAWMPKASELNEHSSIAVKSDHGEVFFRQIAGTFARRIVTYSKPGDHIDRGTQCGLIKFGSRIDIFLPLDSEIKVEIGDEVAACVSVIAELPE